VGNHLVFDEEPELFSVVNESYKILKEVMGGKIEYLAAGVQTTI